MKCPHYDVHLFEPQMSTRSSRKRKASDVSTDKQTRRKVPSTQDLIFKVKAVKVARGVFHYFGKTKTSQREERLTPEWMNDNCMLAPWRKRSLRGKRNKKLGKWVPVPVGSKTKDVSYTNPCVPGK